MKKKDDKAAKKLKQLMNTTFTEEDITIKITYKSSLSKTDN